MKKPVLTFLLLFSLVSAARAADAPLVALEVELRPSRLDGCVDCGCRVQATQAAGARQTLWLAFGPTRMAEDGAWSADRTNSYCGQGSYDDVADQVRQTIGDPFLVVDMSTGLKVERRRNFTLQMAFRSRRLTGFDAQGLPEYLERTEQRELRLKGAETFTWTALAPDQRVLEAFRVHEVLVQTRATLIDGDRDAAFAQLLVKGDVPGASVWLDGGYVGLLGGDGHLVLDNVRAGKRSVSVRDFSGREASDQVRVRKGRTTEIALDVLKLDATAGAGAVVPIGTNPQGHQEYWRLRDRAMMVEIPAGPFLMGSAAGVGEANERPQHEVVLPAYLIDKNEVTSRQFSQFAGEENLPQPPAPAWGRKDNYPVSFILLEEARQYCAWAGGRLPTEAEWEKAARGTDGWTYPWGDDWDPTRCNTVAGGLHQPEPSGSMPRCVSPWGVLDMVGNVQEWAAEPFLDYPEAVAEPVGRYASHVMRGGGWMTQPAWVRTAFRQRRGPDSRLMDNGFRCVMDAPEATP